MVCCIQEQFKKNCFQLFLIFQYFIGVVPPNLLCDLDYVCLSFMILNVK